MLLDPIFSERIKEVFGLKNAPLTLDDLKSALGDRLDAIKFNVDALFSAQETLHEVDYRGENRHTHCAADALMLLSGREASKLKSLCPHCGQVVTVEATPKGISSSHSEAVLSLGVSREATGPVQQIACPFINLFPSRDHYQAWTTQRSDALTIAVSLEEAIELFGQFSIRAIRESRD